MVAVAPSLINFDEKTTISTISTPQIGPKVEKYQELVDRFSPR
jgi:hypothetical protein